MADPRKILRPRRSLLYMPGANARAMEKARSLPADAVILDLEDAVAPAQKIEARRQVLAAVEAGGFGDREVAVRINAANTPWFRDDLAAFARSPADALVLPKVESAATVCEVAAHLPAGKQIWAMIETPRGVLNVEAIADAHPALTVLVMGTSDLSKELRVPHRPDRLGFLYSLSRCVVAARAAGIDIIDGVYLSLDDEAGFAASCEQGLALGFDGKSLIHPRQIEAANRIFAPDAAAVAHAHRVLECWHEAEALGLGVALLDGKLVENLHAAEAERLLTLSKAIVARAI